MMILFSFNLLIYRFPVHSSQLLLILILHRFCHLLDPPLAAPSPHLPLHPQDPSPLEGTHALRKPRLPSRRRLPPKRSLSRLPVSVPASQIGVSRPLCIRQYLDREYTRRGLPRAGYHETVHQRFSASHRPPSVLQLQLRTVLHALGSHRRLV